jgi:uncharacterized protein YbjT (DUF2867 family)
MREERTMNVVTGATGLAGSQVVRALLDRGEPVRAFVRDPDKARRLFGDTVELSVGDFADPAAVRAALDGAERLVLSGPDDPRRVAWERAAIDAAAAFGVRRIVKVSSLVAEPGNPVAFCDWHGRIEQHLRASGVPAVMLRCGPYMTNVLAAAEPVARDGVLPAPAGDARIAMIDPRDVGAVAAAALVEPGHDGRTYVLTGPAAITYADVAADLGAATGHPVRYVPVSDDDARRAMVRQGLPDFVAAQVVAVFAMLRRGVAERVTSTVETLTGRSPHPFRAFAHDHAALFAPALAGAAR